MGYENAKGVAENGKNLSYWNHWILYFTKCL